MVVPASIIFLMVIKGINAGHTTLSPMFLVAYLITAVLQVRKYHPIHTCVEFVCISLFNFVGVENSNLLHLRLVVHNPHTKHGSIGHSVVIIDACVSLPIIFVSDQPYRIDIAHLIPLSTARHDVESFSDQKLLL